MILVLNQIHTAAAAAEHARKTGNGIEPVRVKAALPYTKQLHAAVSEIFELQDEFEEWLCEDPDRLLTLPELAKLVTEL